MTPLIEKLFSYPGRKIQSFEAMQLLDRRLGHPHRAFRSIHVAGTNGKGSVAAKIAAALQLEGRKTALYTSPHISSYRERIRIDGREISDAAAEKLLKRVFAAAEDLPLSFFDLMTALAFLYFAEENVEYASIEVGLGGRLDATNVIQPVLSVITSIGLEHTALLGSTLEEIAREKGGIAKPGVPLVAGPKAALFFPTAIAAPATPELFYDFENRSIARKALSLLGVSPESIEAGILTRPPCRFERFGDVILDVAHNPDAFRRLSDALRFYHPGETFPFYLAFSNDKDWRQCVEIIRPLASAITFVPCSFPRLIPPAELAREVPGSKTVSTFPSIERGVVCGSFYLMDDARKTLLACFQNPEQAGRAGAVEPPMVLNLP